jgi:hypothetical protein
VRRLTTDPYGFTLLPNQTSFTLASFYISYFCLTDFVFLTFLLPFLFSNPPGLRSSIISERLLVCQWDDLYLWIKLHHGVQSRRFSGRCPILPFTLLQTSTLLLHPTVSPFLHRPMFTLLQLFTSFQHCQISFRPSREKLANVNRREAALCWVRGRLDGAE